MASGLQAITSLSILSGGYSGEATGSSGGYSSWTDVDLSGSVTVSYYYSDSDSADNNNSSRVTITITSSWSATVDTSTNAITVHLTETLNSVVRGNITGNPAPYSREYLRDIYVYDYQGGSVKWSKTGCHINVSETLLGSSVSLDDRTFTLAADSMSNATQVAYAINATQGFWNGSLPSIYADAMSVGIRFGNALPADYIPGKVYSGSDWLSHNRDGSGDARVYTGSSNTNQMRTIGGGSSSGNPPEIYHSSSSLINMRKIGTE